MRVFKVAMGTMPKVQLLPVVIPGNRGRRRQGGLPPVPYRQASARWADCRAKSARVNGERPDPFYPVQPKRR
jgi:hypothetical protein